ncbi:hypothetical protein ACFPOB_06485 [Bosea eneae]|uniref:Uncharacterized protein n=1 Tax=Bosea eneae TaxID=151454 RepID=A0ABW0IPR1_9HYPH
MARSVTPDIGARKAGETGSSPPIAVLRSPEFEAISILLIYWTNAAMRKTISRHIALQYQRVRPTPIVAWQ